MTDLVRGNDLEHKTEKSSAYPGPFGLVLQSAAEGRAPSDHVRRPEHEIFGLAMLGGGRVFGQAHLYGRTAPFPPDNFFYLDDCIATYVVDCIGLLY